MIDLSKLRAALDAASPGPWFTHPAFLYEDESEITSEARKGKVPIAVSAGGFNEPFEAEQRASATLAAMAPDLAQTVLDQAAEIERLKEALKGCKS